jgi:hypothetical protein
MKSLIDIDGMSVIINRTRQLKRLSIRVSDSYNPPMVVLNLPLFIPIQEGIYFIRENKGFIKSAMERVNAKQQTAKHTREEYQAFFELMKERSNYWKIKMDADFSHMTMKPMTSRWGSCNYVKRSISINSRLIDYPQSCLDYVIIHEFAHLWHHDHSARFWELVAKYCPDYKEQRRILRN